MLKKTGKSLKNKYGFENYSDNFPERACVLGMFPSPCNLRIYNGYMSLFMYLLQIRKFDLVDSDYDIVDVPFDLLIHTDDENLDITILNSIPSNNIYEANRIMRNINIISYCNGNFDTADILNNLYRGLLNKGYSEDEVKEIISQIFVLQIVDNYRDEKGNTAIPYATVVTVHDIFDLENTNYSDDTLKQTLFEENPFIHLQSHDNNDRYVIYKSFGADSLAERHGVHRFTDDYAKAPIINYIMSLYLIKALHMSIEHIMINNNFSLRQEVGEVIQKAMEFCSSRKKKYDDFTKEDLEALNEYLMHEIQTEFKRNIPVRVLTEEEKTTLNEQDKDLTAFFDVNRYLNLNEELKRITDKVNFIYQLNDNYGSDEIAFRENTNSGVIEYKKDSAIIMHVDLLASMFNEFVRKITGIVIPENIKFQNRQEIDNYLKRMLDLAKKSVLSDKLNQILDEYCDEKIKANFRI